MEPPIPDLPNNLTPEPPDVPPLDKRIRRKKGWKGAKTAATPKHHQTPVQHQLLEPPPTEDPGPPVDYDLSHLAELDHSTEKGRIVKKLTDLLRESTSRKTEALKLYEPLQAQQEFHRSRCRTCLIRGGNRGGKTLSTAVEVSRAVLGRDPFGKYPAGPIDAYIVGKDWLHIGETIFPKLFGKGAFKIIRDKTTGLMRAYRPWDESDKARRTEARSADPLIPKRYIQSIAWEDKKRHIPSLVTLRNGSRLLFFSGNAEPPQGMTIDIGWLDEEIPRREWFTEFSARAIDRRGRLFWSATPQIGTEQFFELHSKAEEQVFLPVAERDIEEFYISLGDNLHIDKESQEKFLATLSDYERLIRGDGEFASAGRIIWPEYRKSLHLIEQFDIPPNWTRFAAIDPGRSICAVLFGACPDPRDMIGRDDPFEIVLYDEIYFPQCTAMKFGELMRDKMYGVTIEDISIDFHGSAIREIGSGMSIYEQYRDAMAHYGVKSVRRGHGFLTSDHGVESAIEKVRSYLIPSPMTNWPMLRIMAQKNQRGLLESRLPNLEWEMLRWKYKVEVTREGPLATNKPETRGRVHACACLRYLIGMRPGWVPPPKGVLPAHHPLRMAQKLERMAARQNAPLPSPTTFGPSGRY